jgi:hypothetical protein
VPCKSLSTMTCDLSGNVFQRAAERQKTRGGPEVSVCQTLTAAAKFATSAMPACERATRESAQHGPSAGVDPARVRVVERAPVRDRREDEALDRGLAGGRLTTGRTGATEWFPLVPGWPYNRQIRTRS